MLTEVFGDVVLDEKCAGTYRTACEVAGHERDLPLCCQSAIGGSSLYAVYSFQFLFHWLRRPELTPRMGQDFLIKIGRERGCGGSSLLLNLGIDSQSDRGTAISMVNDEGVVAVREGLSNAVEDYSLPRTGSYSQPMPSANSSAQLAALIAASNDLMRDSVPGPTVQTFKPHISTFIKFH